MMFPCFETKLSLTLILCHFKRFRSAKVFSEPATPKIHSKISKVPNTVEPWCCVFRYCPFDFRYTAGPKPRNGFPYESVENHIKHYIMSCEFCEKLRQTRALVSLLGFPTGISGDDVPI